MQVRYEGIIHLEASPIATVRELRRNLLPRSRVGARPVRHRKKRMRRRQNIGRDTVQILGSWQRSSRSNATLVDGMIARRQGREVLELDRSPASPAIGRCDQQFRKYQSVECTDVWGRPRCGANEPLQANAWPGYLPDCSTTIPHNVSLRNGLSLSCPIAVSKWWIIFPAVGILDGKRSR